MLSKGEAPAVVMGIMLAVSCLESEWMQDLLLEK